MLDRRIKLRHIECFTAIQRLGSLKAACNALNLSQPTLSKTLRELEDILGARLMDRDRGGVKLTAAGEVFSEFAGQCLATLRRGLEGVDALRRGGGQTLRVGTLPSVAARLLPCVVDEFRRLSPGTGLVVTDGAHGALIGQLRTGTLDAVIGRMGPADAMQGLNFVHIYSESVVCVARPGHPLVGQTAPDPSSLGQWPVIYPPEGAAIRPLLDRWCLAQGTGPFINRIESVSGAFGRNHTATSDALWFISQGVVAQDLDAGRLVAIDLDLRLTAGPVGLMTRPDAAQTSAERLFSRAVLSAAKNLSTS